MVLTLRNRLKILAYLGAATLFILSMVDGGPRITFSFKRLSALELVLFTSLGLFDRVMWRWRKVPEWLKTGPVLRGTWKGVVKPTDGSVGEILAYLSIRQTYSGIAFRLLTEEMTSESTTAILTSQPEGLTVGEYVYQSTPRDSVRSRSPIHFGAVRFECVGPRPERLIGSYFTDRRTSCELEFSDHRSGVAHTFADAANLFSLSKPLR